MTLSLKALMSALFFPNAVFQSSKQNLTTILCSITSSIKNRKLHVQQGTARLQATQKVVTDKLNILTNWPRRKL